MGEILTASKLNDTKRIKEILAMTKSRLSMKFQSSGHTTAALRALSYASPSAKFKDMTNGIDFYQKIVDLSEHFEEEKESITATLINLTKKLFRPDNMMISYTASKEGMDGLEKMIANLSERLYKEVPEETPCIIHCEKKNEGFYVVVEFKGNTGLPKELDRRLRISDDVMRHIIICKEA